MNFIHTFWSIVGFIQHLCHFVISQIIGKKITYTSKHRITSKNQVSPGLCYDVFYLLTHSGLFCLSCEILSKARCTRYVHVYSWKSTQNLRAVLKRLIRINKTIQISLIFCRVWCTISYKILLYVYIFLHLGYRYCKPGFTSQEEGRCLLCV